MTDYKLKGLSSNIKKLALFNFFIEFKFYSPILVIVLVNYMGTYLQAMSILAVMSLSAVVMEFPTGILSDAVGRKKTMVAGTFCNVLALLLWSCFPFYEVFLVGAFLFGTATALFSGNNEALLFDSLKNVDLQEEYHAYLGRTNSTLQIALALTSVMGTFIAAWSIRLVLFLSLVPQIIALITALFIVDPGRKAKISNTGEVFRHSVTAFTKTFKNKKLMLLIAARGLNDAFSGSSYQLQSAFINGLWPLWAVGIIRSCSNLLAGASFYFSGTILKYLSKRTVLILSNLYGRVSAVLALLLNRFISPILLASSSAFFGASFVTNSALIQEEFSDEERATMGSIVSFFGSIILSLISIAVGYIADKLTVRKSLLIIQLFMLIPLPVYLYIFWKKKENVKRKTIK
jgi:MFS family permease